MNTEITRSSTANRVTESPAATTVPARSDPGVKGKFSGSPRPVSITILSRWFKDTAATLIRSSPGPGCGTATSRSWSASRPIPSISHRRMISAMSRCNQVGPGHIPRGMPGRAPERTLARMGDGTAPGTLG